MPHAKKYFSPLHCENLSLYVILIHAYFYDEQFHMADYYFSKALGVLDYHWGNFHPMQITIYNTMANLYAKRGDLKDANYLLQSSINCCLAVLGASHIKTAQVHTDLGKL